MMLEVFFTIDVEIWCDGWQDIDAKFPSAFQRYVYGPGGRGALVEQLQVLSDHGLRSVCFVEPLFAGRFGLDPLAEIIGQIQEAGHEVQMHLHTEWVDEARTPLLPAVTGKRQHLRYFSREEQSTLIRIGAEWLQRAGASRPTAFRAGSFAFNADTLAALTENGIGIDASYNASTFGPSSGVCEGELLEQARQIGPVLELPMTVYADGLGLRHTQLTACSWGELEGLLWQAADRGPGQFVLLSHNFELLTPGQRAVDPVVLRRLLRLAAFLDRHRDRFRVRGLQGDPPQPPSTQYARLSSPLWRTGLRLAEQAWRRRHAQ
jgi:peptidoglycan/xylan/chitin deacetylase (PgdA/CDA1 family)